MGGLKLVKRNEQFASKAIFSGGFEYQGIYADDVLELCMYKCKAGLGFTIGPMIENEGIASYYVYSGACVLVEEKKKLFPGDYCIIKSDAMFYNVIMFEDSTFVVHRFKGRYSNSTSNTIDVLKLLIESIDAKDAYTKRHSDRVCALAKKMGLACGFTGQRYFSLIYAAQYHDIGKVLVDDAILNKKGKLSCAEFSIMKQHPKNARNVLSGIFDESICVIIEQHHERIDGSGYPYGLRGNDISLEAQIIGICDSYDAIISQRAYKETISPDWAVDELKKYEGTLFDIELLKKFFTIIDKSLIEVCTEYVLGSPCGADYESSPL